MDADETPWDVVEVFECRKYWDHVALKLALAGDAPRPTPRTLHSRWGFRKWCEWLDDARERQTRRKEGADEEDWPGGGLPLLPPAVLAFDHIEWRKSQTLVLYDYEMSWMWTKKAARAEIVRGQATESGQHIHMR